MIIFMSIQILQYEFLGPIKLDEWGPPMEKVVYLILSRKKDTFSILFVGDCEKTDDVDFFIKNPSFKCWAKESGSEQLIYLAILPISESVPENRAKVVSKIISKYQPICNVQDLSEKPSYIIRSKKEPTLTKTKDIQENICPCCGSEMKIEKVLEKSSIYRCIGCGMSDTKINS